MNIQGRTAIIARWTLITLMIATLIFIFYNSSKPPEASAEQSNGVQDAVLEVVPEESDFADFIKTSLRELAHCIEYGLLGLECALYLILFERKRLALSPFLPLVALVVGFIDETVQIASGRDADIVDVWLDIAGFSTLAAAVFAVFGAVCLIRLIIKRRQAVISENSNG